MKLIELDKKLIKLDEQMRISLKKTHAILVSNNKNQKMYGHQKTLE